MLAISAKISLEIVFFSSCSRNIPETLSNLINQSGTGNDRLTVIQTPQQLQHLGVADNDEDAHIAGDRTPSQEQFQSLIKSTIAPQAVDEENRGHHKQQSTTLLLDSLKAAVLIGNEGDDVVDDVVVDTEQIGGGSSGMNGNGRGSTNNNLEKPMTSRQYITWGMVLVELDNFEHLVSATDFEPEELIQIVQNLIEESLEFESQYVDHMTQGLFVLLTPVNVVVDEQMDENDEADSERLYEMKEDRLRDIAASVLQQLSVEEEGLEFCMGVALQDRVVSDQEWFEIARQSLEEMKVGESL